MYKIIILYILYIFLFFKEFNSLLFIDRLRTDFRF